MPKTQRWKEILNSTNTKPQIFSRKSVFVQYKQDFSQISCPRLSHCIELAWEKAILKASYSNRCIPYDAPKFRLAGVNYVDRKIFLKIGMTSYKNYIAYRTDVNTRNTARSIAKKKNKPVSQFLPNVIGHVAIVQTTDEHVIVIKRNHNVSSYSGYLDLPGGHPEPSHIGIFSENNTIEPKRIESLIRNELFDSILSEVQKEIGVPISKLSQPKILTILVNLCDVMTPDIVFLQSVDLTAEEVKRKFQKHKKSNWEIQKLILFNPRNQKATKFQKQTPIMEGAFSVFQTINKP